MKIWLVFANLFFIGSMLGWVIELLYRRFFSKANPERKWINPGFCVGPWIPLYGSGLCILFIIAYLGDENGFGATFKGDMILFVASAIILTVIEYLAGLICLKFFNMRLWDYRNEFLNLQGLICLKFTFFWWVLSGLYYFCVHPHVLMELEFLSENLAYSFFIGLFFGIFIIDASYSSGIAMQIRQFAKENDVVVIQEHLKARIKQKQAEMDQKVHFLLQFRIDGGLAEHLKSDFEAWEDKVASGEAQLPRIEFLYKAVKNRKRKK